MLILKKEVLLRSKLSFYKTTMFNDLLVARRIFSNKSGSTETKTVFQFRVISAYLVLKNQVMQLFFKIRYLFWSQLALDFSQN